MFYLVFFAITMITIVLHEAGHAIMALICGVKVEIFTIGMFRPFIEKKWHGIKWRFSPWLIGGSVKMSGENDKSPDGFLVQPYCKKLLIVLAGVFVNLIIALVCYWINYKSFLLGIYIDWVAIKSVFTQNYDDIILLVIFYKPSLFLLQLSMLNIFCFASNLIPWPALDGSYIFLPWLEYVWKENYVKYLNITTKIGFWSLMILQVGLLVWLYLL